jgi:predicted component of type VI protein secretion system
MAKNNIYAPFLSKFSRESVYIQSDDELYQSIIEEIENILSSRLKIPDDYTTLLSENTPFSYGVRDIQSIGGSNEEFEKLKTHYRDTILRFEPRLLDIEIGKMQIHRDTQTLKIEMTCVVKNSNKKFTTSISTLN